MKNKNSERKKQNELVLPKWTVPIVWTVIELVIQIILPWAISKLGIRFGWSQSTPGLMNYVGIFAIILGLALYIWCLAYHYRSYQDSVRIGFSPPELVKSGPYQISRNPMYMSGLFAWLGWVIFYGSVAVFIALVLLWLLFTYRVIPSEERQLEKLFEDEYIEYKQKVNRWIGRV